jgi:hypothetical protein
MILEPISEIVDYGFRLAPPAGLSPLKSEKCLILFLRLAGLTTVR